MGVIVIYIYIKKVFLQYVSIYINRKNNQFYVKSIYISKYPDLSWAIKMEYCIIEKSQ